MIRSIIIQGAYPYHANRGTALISNLAILKIHKQFPNASIFINGINFEHELWDKNSCRLSSRISQIPLIQIQYTENHSKLLGRFRFLLIFFKVIISVNIYLLRKIKFYGFANILKYVELSRIDKADIVFDLRGGDNFSDSYGFKWTLMWMLECSIPLLLNTPMIFLPQSFGPFKNKISRFMAYHILRKAKFIHIREDESFSILEELGLSSHNLHRSTDLALSEEVHISTESIEKSKSIINVAPDQIVLALTLPTALETNTTQVILDKIISGIADEISNLIPSSQVTFLSVPYNGQHLRSPTLDYFESHFADIKLLRITTPDLLDAEGLRAILGQCTLHISFFLHAAIASISAGTPCILISDTHKAKGLFEKLDLSEFHISLHEFQPDRLRELILYILYNKDMISCRINNALLKQKALGTDLYPE